MLRELFIISPSGVVLFHQECCKISQQPRLLGSLMTALVQSSLDTVGAPFSYILLNNVSLAVSIDERKTNVLCALLYDTFSELNDKEFGLLLSSEILRLFIRLYGNFFDGSPQNVINTSIFFSFREKLSDILKGCVAPVLQNLSECGPLYVALVFRGSVLEHCLGHVDELQFIANLEAMIKYAHELVSLYEKCKPLEYVVNLGSCVLLITPISEGFLVTLFPKSSQCLLQRQSCITFLNALIENLHPFMI